MAIWAGTREGMDDVVKGNFVDCVEAGGGFRDADGAAEEFGGEVGETDVALSTGFDEVGWAVSNPKPKGPLAPSSPATPSKTTTQPQRKASTSFSSQTSTTPPPSAITPNTSQPSTVNSKTLSTPSTVGKAQLCWRDVPL